MKLSIITLTYNKLDYTKKYIESLYKYTKDFELIIIDNCSSDGTVEYLKELNKHENVKLILNEENLGFSKGNNQGIEIAEGEYIAFLNNDILLSPYWFEECEQVFKQENAAFVSPHAISHPFDKTNNRNFIQYFKNNYHYKTQYDKSFDRCNFACVVTRRDIISKIGGFDTSYTPAFFEDDDYKCRAIEAGYDIFVTNKSCFYHYVSVTSKNFKNNFKKNREYYFKKFKYAEYLTISKNEKENAERVIQEFNKFPLAQFYSLYVFFRKAVNFCKKVGFRK